MARLFQVLAICLLLVGATAKEAKASKKAAPAADCKAEFAKSAQLVKERDALNTELAAAQEQLKNTEGAPQKICEGAEFSITSILSKTGGIALSASEHLLHQTTLDEQIMSSVANLKVHAANVQGRIAAVDYNEYANNLKTHPLYLTHIAPHVSKVADVLTPHMTTAQAHLNPFLQAVQTHYATVATEMEKSVFPTIREHSTRAFKTVSEAPQQLSHLNTKLGEVLEPVFKVGATAAPKHSAFLPKQPVDRLLLLLMTVFFLYISAKLAVTIFVFVAKISLKLLWIPAILLRFTLGFFFFFATGFYCCGLCRRKASKASQADSKKGEARKAVNATVAEIVQLLEASKKESKLLPAAKKLAAVAKSGNPFNSPKSMEGKELTKDILKQAVSKFKELDVKDLAL